MLALLLAFPSSHAEGDRGLGQGSCVVGDVDGNGKRIWSAVSVATSHEIQR
jgi:hypothetical protein